MAYIFNPFTGSFDSSPTVPLVNGVYLPLSGGTLTGLLSSTDSVYIDGTFEAGSGATVALFVDNNLVGVNTETPNEALTIVGNVSATGTVYAAEGSSVEWQEAYTNLISNSAAYLSSGGGGGGVSGDYLPLSGGLMSGPIGFGDVNGGTIYTGYYDSSRSGLSGISLICSVNYDLNWQAGWITSLQQDRVTPMPLYIDSGVGTSLRVWNGAYVGVGTGTEITHNGITFSDATTQTTAFTGNTLTFDETTKDLTISNGNTVSLSSLVDLTAVDIGVRALTANWESTYTTVGSNSANWESTYNTVSALSASWSALSEVLVAQVSNADSVTLNRGDVVYTFGATGSVMSVKLASNSAEATSSKTLGIINETIIPNGIGYATVAGRIDKMSFPSPFVDGDALWLGSTPGTFTRVKPIAPNNGVYLGVIERANNGNGIAYIKVQNGYELDEIHDVLINGIQAGDLLQRNSSNTLWINGPLSADGSNITSGTIAAARMPTFNGDITATTTNGSVSAKVVAIQGKSISTQSPSTGQMLQWSGTSWTPVSIPTGGSGGGGLSYYFNFGIEAQSPTTNLSATPNTPKDLGTTGTVLSSSYTSGNLSQTSYDLICGFVSLTGNPNATIIPAGLWDFNIWASATSTVTNQTMMRLFVYKYNGVNQPTLLAESDDIYVYDPSVAAQYIASVVFPQTTILATDRIYIEIRAKSTQNNRQVTLYFGDGRPSHVHTTLPSVGGTGLVKVIDGVYQTPASLLVDADVASNANIAQSKIDGLTDIASKANTTYTTVNSNSANWDSVYSTVQTNSAVNWNYQGTDLKALSGNWQSTFTIVSSNSANWDSVYTNVTTNSAFWVEPIRRFDYVADGVDYAYSGTALPGVLETDAFWKIVRLVFSDTGSLSTTGTAQNVTWLERLTATYV